MMENNNDLIYINNTSKSVRFLKPKLVDQSIRNKLREGDTELMKSRRRPEKGKDVATYVFHVRLGGRIHRRSDE